MPDHSAPPEGTVTFLFTDIEGSTRLLQDLGPAYEEVLQRHHILLRDAISSAGGVEVSTEGDAFFAAFSKAPAAIRCAVAVQRALASEPWPQSHSVRVRIGVHSGEGKIAGGQYIGLDVHKAARVSAAGHGRQVLISETAHALSAESLPAGASVRDLGHHRLKDLPATIRLYDLVIEGLPADFPALRSRDTDHIPEQMTSFVGREREADQVTGLIDRARLVTLTGPGGTGKTRLMIEVAHRVADRYPDGAWFIPLETITDPDLVLPAIARTLGVGEQSGRPMVDILIDELAHRATLLALDNLEQVTEVAPEIAGLLGRTRAPRIVCTSREALRIAGEQQFSVPPLDLGAATQLFVDRARQLKPEFDPSAADLEIIAAICRVLDALPLAVELAAARIRLFPLPTLLARLTDRLGTLSSTARDAPERQRTLRGAIEWSYALLDASEQEIFTRLAAFSGGADLAAIEAIADPAREVVSDMFSVLESLAEKSLLRVGSGATGDPRFSMLETIREYAFERLAQSNAHRPTRDRHLQFFLELAERLESELVATESDTALRILEVDHENIRAAIEWAIQSGRAPDGLHLGGAAWRFWQQRGHLVEGRALLERLLDAPESRADARARGTGLTGYGSVLYWLGDHSAARRAYEEAVEMFRAVDDEARLALALYNLGWVLTFARELDEANRMLDESSSLFERIGDERGRLMVNEGIALAAMIAGDLDRARDVAERVVDEYRRLGMRFHLADTLGLLTSIYLELGDAAGARRSFGMSIAGKSGDVSSRAALLQFGAGLAVAEGRLKDAAWLLGVLQAMRDRGERFFMPSDVIPFRDPEPRVRDNLSKNEFDAAFEGGRLWPIENPIDYLAPRAPLEGEAQED